MENIGCEDTRYTYGVHYYINEVIRDYNTILKDSIYLVKITIAGY